MQCLVEENSVNVDEQREIGPASSQLLSTTALHFESEEQASLASWRVA